ncbi:hypothetical protein Acr_01g0003900 [Actinidia rufa]|uniref:F-box domain-containing protein n=2 Tax=Actinidia TaxID=3624 RepID=A0A7J0E271_9ERIC|nr:hypothetical protein Acr_01g0003900 [Actinidia rufa]
MSYQPPIHPTPPGPTLSSPHLATTTKPPHALITLFTTVTTKTIAHSFTDTISLSLTKSKVVGYGGYNYAIGDGVVWFCNGVVRLCYRLAVERFGLERVRLPACWEMSAGKAQNGNIRCGKFQSIACSNRKKKSCVPSLPKEIVFFILVRLPTDILYNSVQYVCWQWYSIIRNPCFIYEHLHRFTTSGLFIQYDRLPYTPCFAELGKANATVTEDTEIREKKSHSNIESCWQIWNDRNKKAIENIDTMRQENVKKAYWLARYINVAFQVPEATSPRLPRLITWLCPSASNMKLNTDGSARGDPGPAGYGGVFRDELYGYFRKLRDISSLEAEVWGIYKGLTIILENGLNGIDVEIRLGRNHETNPRG